MGRKDQIKEEVETVAQTHGVKPEEVQIFDINQLKKQEHNWKHYGIMHICRTDTHPSHVSMSSE